MRASRRRILARRAAALVAAGLATGAIAAFVLGDEEPDRPQLRVPHGVPTEVRSLVRGLSEAEKVDQLLAVGFEGSDATAPILERLRTRPPGAVYVGGPNWADPAQGPALVAELRAAGREADAPPPLILAAQEGGRYRTLAGLPPGRRQLSIGATGSLEAVGRWARATAEALADAGIDLNLGVVADVGTLTDPDGDRSFGDHTATVTAMTAAAVRGCAAGGTPCAVLHFPGEGASSGDTDLGPATVGQGRRLLFGRDVPPFAAAVQVGAPAVVVSHAFFAAFDAVTPASQARQVLVGLLRRRLQFEGVAISDDLGAGAIAALSDVPRAAVASIAAGADMVLIEEPGRVQRQARAALLRAVRSGEIPRRRLDEAAGRVLDLKRRLGLLPG